MKIMKTVLMLVLLVVIVASLSAQESTITGGVSWLVANQDPSGLWGTAKKTPFRDATVVVSVLGTLDADSTAIDNGLIAVASQTTTSTDYLARKIIAIASCSDGNVPSGLVDSLGNMQNDDGGWGYRKGYGSNVLETALALRALKGASYSNMTKLGMGVNYLISQQNADYGWSFVGGDSSRVFYAAHAIVALAAFAGDFSVATQISNGVNWLKTQAHIDGGFGTGGASNPYETGLALAAMIKGDPSATQIANAITHLETTQLPDGSWNTDAYSTAKAIFGLIHVGPDLAINASDVVLSNPTPSDSELVDISATIRNRGVIAADDILVRVLDGHPDFGGVQIGADVLISALAPGADSTIQVEWNTYGLAGNHDIYVLVDPLNEIREPEKLNNSAKKTIHVYFPPDLAIDENGIAFIPPEPDTLDAVTIRTTVKNKGELTATNVSLQVWDGDPATGGIPLLSPYIIPSISPGSQFTLNLDMGNYFHSAGPYPIFACADVNGAIREIRESNNCQLDTLWVGYQCQSTALNVHLNLLGAPLEPRGASTSYTLIPEILTCNEIDGWDRATQRWISAADIGGGVIVGDEFPIALRDGFFARVSQAGASDFCGTRVVEHGCTSLQRGLNMVSIPNEDACYTGYSLIDDISACVEAHRWNGTLQAWVTAAKIGPGQFIGEDFPVRPGSGFFVKVNASGQWCTTTCDTVITLPDLVVTSNNIYISPNPAIWGQQVAIAVNVFNIGLETAHAPRFDLYMRDPDAGGIFVAGDTLPDIPPGGSSGYWGWYVSFSGSGSASVDMYYIVDKFNAIAELNENNNKAYKTLYLQGALAADAQAGSQGDVPGITVTLGNDRNSRSPHFFPGISSTPIQTSSFNSPPRTGLGVDNPAKGASFEPATRIDNVLAANHSSSSVTISWLTDAHANGSINYGATPTLGLTKCEDGAGREVHLVVLDNLVEDAKYYFEIVSGGITDNNHGNYYSFTTTKSRPGVPAAIYGRVIDRDTDEGIGGVLVCGALRHGETSSHPFAALTNSDGIWILNLGNLKSPISNDVMPYESGDAIELRFIRDIGNSVEKTVLVSDSSPQDCGVQEIGVISDAGENKDLVPTHYYLAANYPNPFNPRTTIRFGLPTAGHVDLSIYNVLGQRVRVLVNDEYQAGNHVATWNGQDASGTMVTSGIYFCRIKAGTYTATRKMLLLK